MTNIPFGVGNFSDLQAQQYRLQMMESYRQSTAMTVLAMLAKDHEDNPPKEAAKRAKAYADALTEVMFPEE
jgi:hypothetical protein